MTKLFCALAVILFLTACDRAAAPAQVLDVVSAPTETPLAAAVPGAETESNGADAPQAEVSTADDENAAAEQTDAEPLAEIGPPPPLRTELYATDPATVVIGNGKPQVVEFFAFW